MGQQSTNSKLKESIQKTKRQHTRTPSDIATAARARHINHEEKRLKISHYTKGKSTYTDTQRPSKEMPRRHALPTTRPTKRRIHRIRPRSARLIIKALLVHGLITRILLLLLVLVHRLLITRLLTINLMLLHLTRLGQPLIARHQLPMHQRT